MTTDPGRGSRFFMFCLTPLISVGCGTPSDADPARTPAILLPSIPREPVVPGETCLGVTDKGIWSDLDEKIQIRLPADLTPARVSARLDAKRNLLVLSIDGFPRK